MRYFETKKTRIEVVPMIDIMFFLLVFFIMITLKMMPSMGMSAKLPGSSTAQDLPHPKVLVALHADGSVEADHQPVTLDALTASLRAHDPEHTVVTIASEKTANVQQLTRLMDACRTAGVTQIGIATKEAS
ncbi:biopolymer transport protein ExbD/TolR [Pandoraea horticolens]|uniref:Biopolymer transport protein ExbD/TolR n=1 Tax=Pandoraea horticolens TaxID=2508298 RepID=A0A5E4XMA4_9BURK|nr:biopolymer transporter ExbD [Pandoraea horticolens]VVE37457.1 biopolymer transport protein ExbD/TolR [Pandoraea horticolens]